MLIALPPVFVGEIKDYPVFDEVKIKGGIGILCVQLENGEWTLE